ncbi:glycosyltransferase [Gymnodinialimonas sp. 2305UL16-5]|uniref:glycosyltransferase n=1 Tax=Gymnodinialimonas mytili TaxID=3126503 RepID=UPI0030AC1334
MVRATGLRAISGLWLDVTRLASRASRFPLTGIDRVELAYLRAALGANARFLCRTTRGYLLLDDRGATVLAELAEQTRAPVSADALSALLLKSDEMRHRVEATLRPHAMDRCLPHRLSHLIDRHGAEGMTYLNVGHSNLSQATLGAFHDRPGTFVTVLIHDLIPILHPDLVADGMAEAFAGRVDAVRRHADLVICNSRATLSDLEGVWAQTSQAPPSISVPLGVRRAPLLDDLDRDPRHFIMLGTIEPRKNHALMIDVWEMLAKELSAAEMPQLHIIGSWGWKSDALKARLQAHPQLGHMIHLEGGLSDDQVQNHLARANALLFPSLAEGYGYPPLEAALAGAMPICSDLPVFRETLSDCVIYVTADDATSWKETIKQQIRCIQVKPDLGRLSVPTWDEHFGAVVAELDRRRGEAANAGDPAIRIAP